MAEGELALSRLDDSRPGAVRISRREFSLAAGGAILASGLGSHTARCEDPFALRYILASALYGTMDLATILPEVRRTGAERIDLWPAPHGNQREQAGAMGADRFGEMLERNGVQLGGIACYRPGPFGLASEIDLVRALHAREVVLVSGAGGPKGLSGEALKRKVSEFVEKMKPHVERAAKADCTVAIENHGNDLLESEDAIRWFGEMVSDAHFGLALAPHHLPQDSALIARLVRDLGPGIKFVYAQQRGKGFHEKVPKEEELLQMPGRGPLDFGPIVQALRAIDYQGYTEIFMHPVPRGVPILETAEAITAEVNRARKSLERGLC